MPGKVYNVPPMPPDADTTDYFEVGPLRIGIEYRQLDPAAIDAAYEGDADSLSEIRANSPDGGFSDEGFSIHVESIEDDHEYLRFDAFSGDPHYHYVDRLAGTNTIVEFDVVAHGEMVPWILECLRDRIGPMLTRAGAEPLARQITKPVAQSASETVAAHLSKLGILTD